MTKALAAYLLLITFCLSGIVNGEGKGITNTSKSPYVKFRSIDIDSVQWTDGFWADRLKWCHEIVIPNMWRLLQDPNVSHAYDNFLVAAGLKEGRHKGPKWHDGDFYKWLEAASFVYAVTRNEELNRQMDRIIDVIGKAQREDGYIHTPVIISEQQQLSQTGEFKNRLDFETYNMGHLMTCACIHYRSTGKDSLLNIAKKAADFLYKTYKESPRNLANNAICPSHYMGVTELYRTVDDPRYLELAKGLIEIRDLVEDGTDHNQDRIPFRQQNQAVGHAVRANYLYAGVADVYAETGDKSLLNALEKIWQDVAYRKMYVTGATGALYDGASPDGSKSHSSIQLVHQAYGRAYQLPNITAYNESCAAVGFALWNWRMLAITAQARFADLLELSLYNSILGSISLDGRKFFYTNPLRRVDELPFELRWSRRREPYISCFCCPPNIVRTLAEVSAYAYSMSDEGIWINLYGSNVLNTHLADGSALRLRQKTDYPWDGTINITLEDTPEKKFSFFLRIPGWAKNAIVTINDEIAGKNLQSSQYYEIQRIWSAKDRIKLVLPMPAQLIEAHPLVEEARYQTAIRRGTIVYCLESTDLPEDVSISDVSIPSDIVLHSRYDRELLGGIVALNGKARIHPAGNWDNTLYRPMDRGKNRDVDLRLIPYYAWDNRGDSEMTVWMPLENLHSDTTMFILNPDEFKHHIDFFNTAEPENIVNFIPNSSSWEWLLENIPFFECPDKSFEQIYYFRWWTFRKHLKKTPDGFVFTEFLDKVGHSGKYNTISCALGHHIYEGTWLHDKQYIDDYARFWYSGHPRFRGDRLAPAEAGGDLQPHFHRYSNWSTWALYRRYLVNQDKKFIAGLLEGFIRDYKAWEKEHGLENGLFWQYDVRDGMEESISGSRNVKNTRPPLNSYMYANAVAISKVAELVSRKDIAAEYAQKAERLKSLMHELLWDREAKFFKVRRPNGELADVREEIGFIPWYFNLPDPGYEQAWLQLTDPEGFKAPMGITTAERRHPDFRSHGVGTCEWDGAVWPYATSQTLVGLSNVLRNYEQQYVSKADYFDALVTYARSHHYKGKPYIGEYLDEMNGEWL
ncbi:MAG: glycoside hydrolase family 127 protein, partial [Sedimentisphaerales bacterium]|nr:glycoside hydrolase family 127 protein [Sedimentisphaerales bacterium]